MTRLGPGTIKKNRSLVVLVPNVNLVTSAGSVRFIMVKTFMSFFSSKDFLDSQFVFK